MCERETSFTRRGTPREHTRRARLWIVLPALWIGLPSCAEASEPVEAPSSSQPQEADSRPPLARCSTASIQELEYELWCHALQATRLADKPLTGEVAEPSPQECYALTDPSTGRPGVERMNTREVRAYLRTLHGRRPAVLFHAANLPSKRLCTWLLTAEGVAASEVAPIETTTPPLPSQRTTVWSLGYGLSSFLDLKTREAERVTEPRNLEPVDAAPLSLPEVAEMLLPPRVAKGLIDNRVDTLIVVPIYDVGAVPFAALPLDGQPLIERMSVLIAPSFQSFEHAPRTWLGEPVHPLVIGDPAGAAGLTGARLEATEVATELGAVPFLGSEATIAGVTQWLHEYPDTNLVHIAAHGIAQSIDADSRSGLFLDTFWSAEDVWSLDLSPDSLVVLSACQSGLGAHFEMGTASVARAFHHDGASAVVMSLWNVDDASTRKLMVAFTRYAFDKGSPTPPDRALQRAMVELQKTEADPMLWAGFNVFGLPALERQR